MVYSGKMIVWGYMVNDNSLICKNEILPVGGVEKRFDIFKVLKVTKNSDDIIQSSMSISIYS